MSRTTEAAAETTAAETADAETPAPQTIDEYKAMVRAEAMRVAKEQSWCDDGLNNTLRTLGLPEKQTYRIPVELTEKRVVFTNVHYAASEAEAQAQVLTEEYINSNIHLNGVLLSAIVPQAKDPDEQVKGDLDTTYARRNQCESYDTGFYCTRQRGHDGKQHIYGNGEFVQRVWPITSPPPVIAV